MHIHNCFADSDEICSEGDKTGNAFAGSLIDSGVTHPAVRDFYLQSHAAIQGSTCDSCCSLVLSLKEYFSLPLKPLYNSPR